MGFKCGIVGLPNVGKSTLFNALTNAKIDVANYPFCTIEPNVGIVQVPDLRLKEISAIVNPNKIVPTTVEFVDIAGLVEGASKGEGLGNKFLSHIRETNAIVHVVRCFDNEDITHVSETVDPVRDAEIINTELILSDIASLEKFLTKLVKQSKSGDKSINKQIDDIKNVLDHLNNNKPARTLKEVDLSIYSDLHLITVKPVLYVANINEYDVVNNKYIEELSSLAQKENAEMIEISAAIESELSELDNIEDRVEILNEYGLNEPGLARLIRAGYKLLNLKTYFTAGKQEVRAWTFKDGMSAPSAAGVIHTDFEKGFIRAEVISYNDYTKYHGEAGAREHGKLRVEGKNYIVQDGDVMHFLFNV